MAPARNHEALLWSIVAVPLGALLLTWPALYSGYPLLYPDSMTYLEDGRPVARALFLHRFSDYYGMRSFIYSLGILPWHWNVSPVPIVALNALLAAFVIWLVTRSVLPRRTGLLYLILLGLLSLLTSLSWFVSLIMPDILGPLLYLCIYLVVFARETLTRAEHMSVAVLAWWAVASHATHLILAAGVCVLLALLLALRFRPMRGRWRAVGEVSCIVLIAVVSQVALHAYLNGEPSLNGERPPFLTARLIADGPGRWYLEQSCPAANLVVCDFIRELPHETDAFLWGDDSILQKAGPEGAKRMRDEEAGFALATLRTYPREQLSSSAANFWQQLTAFGLWDLGPNGWVPQVFDHALPGQLRRYLESRQARDVLPLDLFTSVHNWTVIAALVIAGVCAPLSWRWRRPRLAGLSVVIAFTVVANALVTGALSSVEDRYEARVIWLVPLLAGLLLFDLLINRGRVQLGTIMEALRLRNAHPIPNGSGHCRILLVLWRS